jgi:nitroreductase
MADLMEVVRSRRSVRKFEDRPVSDETLAEVLEAVKWAPSWANTQCWEIIMVRDPAIREKLQATFPPAGNPALKAIVRAPVLLALCARLRESGYYKGQVTTHLGDWFMFDLGIAAQNLCLAAHDYGLGTVIVGLFDQLKAKAILKVPDSVELVALVPMGYPAKKSSAPARKDVKDFLHENTF